MVSDITNVMDVASLMAVVHTVRLAPPPVVGLGHVDPVPSIYCPLTCRYNHSDPSVVLGHKHVHDRDESLVHIHIAAVLVLYEPCLDITILAQLHA